MGAINLDEHLENADWIKQAKEPEPEEAPVKKAYTFNEAMDQIQKKK